MPSQEDTDSAEPPPFAPDYTLEDDLQDVDARRIEVEKAMQNRLGEHLRRLKEAHQSAGSRAPATRVRERSAPLRTESPKGSEARGFYSSAGDAAVAAGMQRLERTHAEMLHLLTDASRRSPKQAGEEKLKR